ncbi:hypothetical protein RHS01_06869 [Rhizoctonia solani]|uniref:Chromo domain-containing protein n=1 Tax=Rhizoctonia solani TaxID=456999 RepID=A0A8H7I9F7_9AGAM|nr:hypothetical protein RHS01_06869 [Rhizoctonia solani]
MATHTIPFLVCPIGNTPAILGMTWLTAEAPFIDWQQGLVTFPEQVQIASEEEADLDPLADLPPQYHEFARVFGEEEFKVLPPHREYDIAIDLVPDAKLTPGPIYGMTDAESKALKQHINEELATGKICPSTSSAGAPVMFKLNDVTHKNVYPLPRQDDLMAKLRHAKMFTKLDLRWGYNNVRIKEGDEWKTAFRTKYGLFEYLVMPFGLTNAPAAFQHFMNNLFRDLIDVTVVIYLDDILIFSEDPKDHPTHVRKSITVDEESVSFPQQAFPWTEEEDRGSHVMANPKTVKQVQAFLGFKGNPMVLGNQEEEAFQELKSLVTKSPVLIHSNPELPYYLETDASGVAMGAILSQQGPDNRLHPIAYMSKSFSGAEANYDTHNKELLAIIKALEEWRIFLEATDRPIQMAHIPESDFNFEIHYCPGKQSGKPDALSRQLDYVDTAQEPEVMLPSEVFANASEEELEIVTEFLTKDADNAPPSIRKAYRDYDWKGSPMVPRETGDPDNESLKERLLREFHDSPLAGHPGQQRTLELLSQSYWWPGMKSTAKEWVECCPTCQANQQAHAPVISLKPLEVPPFPFHTISYDFITGFPKSNGHNAILVVIDSFSKFGHFILTSKKVTAKGLADLFVSHGPLSRLGIKPSFSSAYHPESDGQTERTGLRGYLWQNMRTTTPEHASTGKTPFELIYGKNPVMNPSNVPSNVPEADQLADTLANEWKEAESALRMSKEKMTRDKGTIPKYSVGEMVWLDGKNVELRTNSNKLDPKRLGPFEVLEKISSHAYRLKLPETLKIHNVTTPPETIEGEEEYEVEQILDSKRQRGKWFYLIKWKGYGPEDNSWEPEELLEHSQEEIQRFNKSRLKKARDSAKSL